jgi:hypothetical protein
MATSSVVTSSLATTAAAVVAVTQRTGINVIGGNINGWFDKIGIGDVIINESVHYLNLNDILCLSTVNRYFHYLLNLSFIINQQQQPSSATSAPSSSSTSTSSASSTESIASISHVSTTQTINGRRVISLLPSQWLISSLIFHFDLSTLPSLTLPPPSSSSSSLGNVSSRPTPNVSDNRYSTLLDRYSHRIRSIRFRETLPRISSMSWPRLQVYEGMENETTAPSFVFDEGKWLWSLPNLQSISFVPNGSLQDTLEEAEEEEEEQSLPVPVKRLPTICDRIATKCITCSRLTWGTLCAAYPSCPIFDHHQTALPISQSNNNDNHNKNGIGGRQCRQCYRSSILKVPVTLHEQVRRIADIYGEWIVCSGGCERWTHNTTGTTSTSSTSTLTTTRLQCDREWVYCNDPACGTRSRACPKCSSFFYCWGCRFS